MASSIAAAAVASAATVPTAEDSIAAESGQSAEILQAAQQAPVDPETVDIVARRTGVANIRPESAPRRTWHAPANLSIVDIPFRALSAYGFAAATMKKADPDCGLEWSLLAAVGEVETQHGEYDGATLTIDGTTRPAIRGLALDGSDKLATIPDTDGGRLDGDRRWDRAVGPMQFIPSTWRVAGVDADGDGTRDPDDIDDAALSAAVYLCAAPGTLEDAKGRRTALLSYNASPAYVNAVLDVARAYRAGDFSATSPSPTALALPAELSSASPSSLGTRRGVGRATAGPSGAAGEASRTPAGGPGSPSASPSDKPTKKPASGPDGKPSSKPSDKPSDNPSASPADKPLGSPSASPSDKPSESPADKPSETPSDKPSEQPSDKPSDKPSEGPAGTPAPAPSSPPADCPSGTLDLAPGAPYETSGAFGWCADSWYLGGVRIDAGGAGWLATTARADFDGDGAVETNAAELSGLSGGQSPVTLIGPSGATDSSGGPAAPILTAIAGVGYLP